MIKDNNNYNNPAGTGNADVPATNKDEAVSGRPYDDTFKTMLNDCRNLLIPLINEIFGKNYSMGEKVTINANEHILIQKNQVNEGKWESIDRTSDSSCSIAGDRYLIECQSRPDSSMIVRMYEYIILDSLDSYELEGNTMKIYIPQSAVLFLRSAGNTPDMLNMVMVTPGGSVEFPVHIVRIDNYSLECIFDKKLYFLLPFYIFNYESEFNELNSNEEKLETLKLEYKKLVNELQRLTKQGELSYYTYGVIIDMMKYVLQNIANKYENIRKGVDAVMGGTVLEYESKTIYNEGMRKGREEGREKGREEGKKEGILEGRVKSMYYDSDLTVKEIAMKLGKTEEDITELIKK